MYIPQFDIPKFEDRHPIRARVCKKNIVIDYGKKHLCFMLTVKALVVRLVEENTHRARTPVYPNLRNVEFIAKFLVSNATLQCTLQDRLQAHHIVPGNELSLTIVGVREEIGALLVDVDEGPGVRVKHLAPSHGNKREQDSQQPSKKRHFFNDEGLYCHP